jgi:tetratricopeptide (TPR) repeat protein
MRPLLREAELAVSRIRGGVSADEILDLYDLLDQIAAALPGLEKAGANLEAERARFETIGATLRDQGRPVVRELSAGKGLQAYRLEIDPSESRWWWYLDRQVAQARAVRRTRLVRGALIGATLVATLVILYVLFLRPDETTRLRYDYQFEAELYVQQGDYVQALEPYLKAIELAPEDAELHLAAAVLYEVLDQTENAEKQYAEAKARYETPAVYLTGRAQQFLRLGRHERAAREAQAAIELDKRNALAHCLLGSAHQGLGDNNDAIAALSICADLASEQGQGELYVHAKTRLANLIQQPS